MKVGDKARVIGNHSGRIHHYFPYNSIVTITEEKDDDNCYIATATEDDYISQFIHEKNLEFISQEERND